MIVGSRVNLPKNSKSKAEAAQAVICSGEYFSGAICLIELLKSSAKTGMSLLFAILIITLCATFYEKVMLSENFR